MPRLSLLSPARPFPTMLAKGLVCVAMISIQGFAIAQEAPASGKAGPAIQAAEDEDARKFQSIEWEEGPGTVALGPHARLRVSRGFVFTGPEGGKTLLELGKNPPAERLLGVMAPLESLDWAITFEWKPAIKRGVSPARIDADSLLRELREEDEHYNAIRRSRGWPECKGVDWVTPPAYEGSRNDLTFTTKYDIDGKLTMNCTTRIIGRDGTIEAYMVVDPKDMDRLRSTFRNIMSLVEFNDEVSDEGGQADTGRWSTSRSGSDRAPRILRRPMRTTRVLGAVIAVVVTAIGGAYRKLRGS